MGRSSPAGALIRSWLWSMISTASPDSAGTSTDFSTRTPPWGSVSLARASTIVAPPAGSIARSSEGTGRP